MSERAREVIEKTLDDCAQGRKQLLRSTIAMAILQDLAAAGLKVVGREPTELMQSIGHYQLEDCKDNNCRKASVHVWGKMWDAADPRGPKETT